VQGKYWAEEGENRVVALFGNVVKFVSCLRVLPRYASFFIGPSGQRLKRYSQISGPGDRSV